MGTIAGVGMRDPGTFNLFNTSRVVKPVVLKSKDIFFRDISTNLHSARQMIRSDPSKGQGKREGEDGSPCNRSEEPINLLQERDFLHITPGITSPFDWQFNQAKVTDYVIENQGIMKIAPCLVSILSISIKVKISH
jgi:hypothetical protein